MVTETELDEAARRLAARLNLLLLHLADEGHEDGWYIDKRWDRERVERANRDALTD